MKLNERISRIRKNKGLSQKDLAERIQTSKSVMNRIEDGSRAVRDDELVKIASVLEISTDKLLGVSNNINPDWADEQDKLDLKKFLDNQQEMYYGDIKLTEEEKKQLNDIVVGVFWKRMKEAKDKQVDKE